MWITPKSLHRQHSLRLGSRSQRCARARSDMIWALSAVSLVRFCSWALSSELRSSVTQPATNIVSPAIKLRRIIVRWHREKGKFCILFSFRRPVCLIAAAVRIAADLRRGARCRRRLREHGAVPKISIGQTPALLIAGRRVVSACREVSESLGSSERTRPEGTASENASALPFGLTLGPQTRCYPLMPNESQCKRAGRAIAYLVRDFGVGQVTA